MPLKFLIFRDVVGFIKYDTNNSELPGKSLIMIIFKFLSIFMR